MVSNNWYKESEESRIYWLDNPDELEIAFSFDQVKIYYLPRDYPTLTDEQRAILDEETDNFWRTFFDY